MLDVLVGDAAAVLATSYADQTLPIVHERRAGRATLDAHGAAVRCRAAHPSATATLLTQSRPRVAHVVVAMSDSDKAALQSYLDEHNVEARLNEVSTGP